MSETDGAVVSYDAGYGDERCVVGDTVVSFNVNYVHLVTQ